MDNSQTTTQGVGGEVNLKRVTMLQLWKDRHFTGISKLNFNKNSYPFITLTKNKASTNLYFTLKASAKIAEQGFLEGKDLIENGFLASSELVETLNKDNEQRFKISIPSLESNYSSEAALEGIWGSQNESEVDLIAFGKTFMTSEQNSVKVKVEEQA